MTLREWTEQHPGVSLAGVTLRIPRVHRAEGMTAVMKIKSGWGMSGGRCGLWLIDPDQESGRVFPVTAINVEGDLMKWEVMTK